MSTFFLQVTKALFKGICFSLAAYLIILQLQNYFRNDDVSSITFKQLNTNPEDHYPTFSFCLVASNKSTTDKLDGTRFVVNFVTKTMTGTEVNGWERAVEIDERQETDLEDFPFYLSYKDESQDCYTRKEIYENMENHPDKVMRKYDRVALDLKAVVNDFKELGIFRIYLHNPGQFIKGIGKELTEGKISQIAEENGNNFIHITISQIVVLKKRKNSKVPCNPDLENEDQKLLEEVINHCGCMPQYWNELTNLSKPNCEQETEAEMITNLTTRMENVTALYNPPCHEMMIVASAERMLETDPKDESHLTIQINYLNEMFLEIENGERFSAQGFLCRIGGFLGMFLGFSLLQIPDLVAKALDGARKKIKKMKLYQPDEKEPL